jgi:hypothetical protein
MEPKHIITHIPRDLEINYIGLDLNATLLATTNYSDNEDYKPPLRNGWEIFFGNCKKRNIKVIASSDINDYSDLSIRLWEGGMKLGKNTEISDITNFIGNYFEGFIHCPHIERENYNSAKDFEKWIKDCFSEIKIKIDKEKLVIIGDNFLADIIGAEKLPAKSIFVPRYYNPAKIIKDSKYEIFYTPYEMDNLIEV